ncbi:MAG: glycosyltransferase family 61 protein [Desulfobulbaceae bacterium]
MMNIETLLEKRNSIRKLPVNLDSSDLDLFQNSIKYSVLATKLLHLKNITIIKRGILFDDNKVMTESFPTPREKDKWVNSKDYVKFLIRNYFFSNYKVIEQECFWITDIWSNGYFHWFADALPRLLTIKEKIKNATLLLPFAYKKIDFITSSLKYFLIKDLKFINGTVLCRNLKMPTHTALTGYFNESIIRELRSLYVHHYQNAKNDYAGSKVYISRNKAERRKILNEDECREVLEEYDFKTVFFEDHTFEEQIKIAYGSKYLISNHGAGLTNMLFMKPSSSVFELRAKNFTNNCYFDLASALNLKYFYQLCDSDNQDNDNQLSNLTVDLQMLKENIEQMLTN